MIINLACNNSVEIITGKGNHSINNEPKLFNNLTKYFDKLGYNIK